MNSVANGKVRRVTPYTRVYLQSAAGDAGGAIGAALHNSRQGGGYIFTTRYWGQTGDYREDQNFTSSGEFGWSSACFYNGVHGSVVFGAPATNGYTGAAYLFQE